MKRMDNMRKPALEGVSQTKTVNAHVESYLNYYCGLEGGPGFAVLLKGDWGVGKTWFIKNYFKQLKNKQLKYIYISLYGVSKQSHIEERLFEAMYPLFTSKPAKLAGIAVKGLIKATVQVDLNRDGKNDGSYSLQIPELKLPNNLRKLEKRVLIFDDLERCKLDIDEVLGYINSFVEEQESKVIILANETEINDEYTSVKEKVIGQTLTVQFDLDSVIQPFASAITSKEAKQSFLEHISLVKDVYQKADYKNLRSLKRIVVDFERIFSELPSDAQSIPDLIESLLRSLTALTIETQKGSLVPNEIGDLSSQYAQKTVAKTRVLKGDLEDIDAETSRKAKRDFLEKHNFLYHSLFPSESWWQRFFDKGVIDKEELKSELDNNIHIQNSNMPDWKKLWYFLSLTEEEFQKVLPRVASDFVDKKIDNALVMKHMFGTLLNLSHEGLYAESPQQVLSEGKAYAKKLIDESYDSGVSDLFASADLLVEIISFSDFLRNGAFGLSYQGSEHEEFEAFEDYARNYGKQVSQSHLPAVAEELLALMKSDKWRFKRTLCLGQFDTNGEKSYHNLPVLKFMDLDKFVLNLMTFHSIEDLSLVGHTLKERYSPQSHNLDEELMWIQHLDRKLSDQIETREGTVTSCRLRWFKNNYIEPIIT